tara:strand:- start:117 stop:425 length:309 start_codon:yes stop_codon:yes gene_type:complete
MFKKTTIIFIIALFITSCANTFDSIKRGLTGAKGEGADEFLVKKKDPLILPPDFENLPTPDERNSAEEELSLFEKNLESVIEDETSSSTSVEDSILKKIQSQ